MKSYTALLVLLFFLFSCEPSNESWEHDKFVNDALARQVHYNQETNKYLLNLTKEADPRVREIVDSTLTILDSMIEFTIELSGGYQEGYLYNQHHLIGIQIRDVEGEMRNNSLGFSMESMNTIHDYLQSKDLPSKWIILDPSQDPIYEMNPDMAKDWYELAFSEDLNTYQILHYFHELKLSVLEVEKNYLLDLLSKES